MFSACKKFFPVPAFTFRIIYVVDFASLCICVGIQFKINFSVKIKRDRFCLYFPIITKLKESIFVIIFYRRNNSNTTIGIISRVLIYFLLTNCLKIWDSWKPVEFFFDSIVYMLSNCFYITIKLSCHLLSIQPYSFILKRNW